MKKITLLLSLAALLLVGCSASEQSREEFARTFVEAVVEGDEDALWEAFTPETQADLIRNFGDDEDIAKAESLRALQEGLRRKFEIEDISTLAENQELFTQTVDALLADESKFVEKDGKWFFEFTIDKDE